MSAPDFLDSNVLIYAYDHTEPVKQKIARGLVVEAVLGHFTISTQVLAEFSSTLLHKLRPPLNVDRVNQALNGLRPIPLVKPDTDIVRRAVEAHATYGIHFYDAMIIAAAERAGSAKIWSEDLNAGQKYFGVAVENPFQ